MAVLQRHICKSCLARYSNIVQEIQSITLRFEQEYGYVYFADSPTDNQVKIGVSITPFSRIKHLVGKFHKPLEFLGFFPGNRLMEFSLHNQFRQYRVNPKKAPLEWYYKVPEIMEFIELNAVSFETCQNLFKEAWFRSTEGFNKKYGSRWFFLFDYPTALKCDSDIDNKAA